MNVDESAMKDAQSASQQVVDDALSGLGDIAMLPEIADKITKAADNDETTAEQMESLVSSDAILSARVLKVVNSAFYGKSGEVGSIRQAIVVLGMTAVKNIAIAASIGKMFRATGIHDSFDAKDLWRHSAAVAAAAKLLARHTGVNPEEAFLVGMLHDVGVVVEIQYNCDGLARAIDESLKDKETGFLAYELIVLGATHEQFGEALCKSWNFPIQIQQAVGAHHDASSLEGEARRLAQTIAVADFVASSIGRSYPGTDNTGQPNDTMEELALTDDILEAIKEELQESGDLAAILSS